MGGRTRGAARRTSRAPGDLTYDAFISYSHAVDGKLARSLQMGLHRFAKPWYRLRSLRVFRDQTSLSANPGLWASITRALDSSRWFVLLASKEAARSEWVGREIEYWIAHRAKDQLLIVLTDGSISWDEATGDFDWKITDALPHRLRGMFTDEPRFVDVTWARDSTDVSLRNSRFAEAVADVAATLHDRPKDELLGEDVRQHRRTRRVAGAAIVTLFVLLVASIIAGLVAVEQRETALAERDRAEQQARLALSRQLAAEAGAMTDDRLDLALLLAAQAYAVEPTAQARGGLLTVLARSPRLSGYLPGTSRPTSLALDPAGRHLAVGTAEGELTVWNTGTLQREEGIESFDGGRVTASAFSLDGELLAAGNERGVAVIWDVRTGQMVSQTSLSSAVRAIAFEGTASVYGAADDEGSVAVWDVGTEDPTFVLDSGRVTGFNTLAFVGDSLVAGDGQGNMTTWTLKGKPLLVGREVAGGGMPLASAYSPDMTLFAGVTLGQQAPYVYDVVEGAFLSEPTLGGPTINIDSLAFAPDGRTLAGTGEGRVVLWDVRAGAALGEELRGVPGGVEESPSDSDLPSEFFRGPAAVGRDVVVAGDWRGVVVFDLSSHTLLRSVHVAGATPIEDVPNVIRGSASAAFSPDGRLLAWTLAYRDTLGIEVVVWDLQREQELMRVPAAGALGFSPDGRTLAVRAFSEEERFTLVDLASGDLNEASSLPWTAQPPGREATARTTPWTVETEGLGASIAFDGTVTLWDTERGQRLGTVEVPGAFDFSALVFAPQGRQLAVASPGGALSIIDTDVRSWQRKACELAGRSLTEEDWNRHIGGVGDLQRSC